MRMKGGGGVMKAACTPEGEGPTDHYIICIRVQGLGILPQ